MKVFRKRKIFDILFGIFAFAILGLSVFFTNKFTKELAQEERRKIDLWVTGIKQLSNIQDANQDFTFIFEVVQNNKSVPVLLIDDNNTIISYRNVPESKISNHKSAEKLIKKMKEEHEPITITLSDGTVNYVLYSDSITLKYISYFPYLQLLAVFAFLLIAFYAYKQSQKAYENGIWMGMAKETAHQLGTPASSLLACVDLIKEKLPNDEVVTELEKDVYRLEVVTDRFSKIGTNPQLSLTNLNQLLDDVIDYLRPRISKGIELKKQFNPESPVLLMLNTTLFEWVLENLTKNSIDAMNGKGLITYSIYDNTQVVFIDVTDNGSGIPRNKLKEIFSPGYTTKDRGWGLGLSLSKRIVEEYHNGKIFVLRSELGVGTTIRVVLKKGNN
ncbi:MAG: HAMP domain-containing histidine kinase [Bacteroidales bacterium]|nr:HAMP domain-containing histidine kinase [Bacteroidales bacterium]HPD94712.1 HAMP domain-containing sensor histidine kinase [Tenuifilaceae bacterium]HRX31230.1 HAMP domain-containing sensor histidine kinase [Tenuifilaceae bacterium]